MYSERKKLLPSLLKSLIETLQTLNYDIHTTQNQKMAYVYK